MQPIYALLTRGHLCNFEGEKKCIRCAAKSESSAGGGTISNGSEKGDQHANASVKRVKRGGVVTTFEMC